MIPPSLSIRSTKEPKSTIALWFTGSPVNDSIVLAASVGPPSCIAALILLSEWPGIGTRRSRGIER